MIKYIYLSCMLSVQLINCRFLPPKQRPLKPSGPTGMPKYPALDLPRMKFPNKEFCYEMEKNWKGSLLLPWWFQRCYDLKVLRVKESRNDNYYPKHKVLLDKIQYYKRNGLLRGSAKAHPTRTVNWARKA